MRDYNYNFWKKFNQEGFINLWIGHSDFYVAWLIFPPVTTSSHFSWLENSVSSASSLGLLGHKVYIKIDKDRKCFEIPACLSCGWEKLVSDIEKFKIYMYFKSSQDKRVGNCKTSSIVL